MKVHAAPCQRPTSVQVIITCTLSAVLVERLPLNVLLAERGIECALLNFGQSSTWALGLGNVNT